jgi:predicted MPP superfamily phosphohydrolase
MLGFAVTLLTLLAFVWYYVGYSLILPLTENHILAPGVWFIFFVTYILQVWRWVLYGRAHLLPRALFITYFSLGFISHLFVAAALKDFLGLFFNIDKIFILLLITICIIMNAFGVYYALRGPLLKKVKINVPQKGENFKIVQISDLHIGPIIKKSYVTKVIQQTLQQSPDMVVITGDLGDGHMQYLRDDFHTLKLLTEKVPVYYIIGNHEYYWRADEWIAEAKAIGITVLMNQGLPINLENKIPIWLGGVPDPQSHRFFKDHKHDPHKAIEHKNAQQHYKILLAHQPASCFEAEKAGFDLMLCGHTHGGQFFPFTLIVGFFNPYNRGLNQHGNMKVYVNLGTGFWGPPLRIGAHAELTEIVLESN